MKQLPYLLLPLAALVGFLLTDSFLLRSGVTLLCLLLLLLHERGKVVRSAVGFVALALLFSFSGDYVLGHWGGTFEGFILGVALFLLAHLGYVAFCLRRGKFAWHPFLVLCTVFGFGYYGFLLRPAIGDAVTSVSVLAYVLVSCLSLAAALGLKGAGAFRILFIAGIGSLLFSDLLIAQKRFLGDNTLYALMMPTYFASQLLVTTASLVSADKTKK